MEDKIFDWSLVRVFRKIFSFFIGSWRDKTSFEIDLIKDNQNLLRDLKNKNNQIEELEFTILKLKSQVEISKAEIGLLGLVHESDRKRWELLIKSSIVKSEIGNI